MRSDSHKGGFDLGGIGKGWCIDQLATAYKDICGYQEFLINGGGDMYATEQTGKPYTVTLTHPTQPDQYIGTVDLYHAGFAASSPFVRSWVDKKTGQRNNHLLSEQAVASYVVAPSCTEADVWATTLALAPHTEPKPHSTLLIDGKKAVHQSPLFSLFT
ncbi:MAG: FAD:protein FMN transferase [Candidatus Paceibacterota bacterium]